MLFLKLDRVCSEAVYIFGRKHGCHETHDPQDGGLYVNGTESRLYIFGYLRHLAVTIVCYLMLTPEGVFLDVT